MPIVAADSRLGFIRVKGRLTGNVYVITPQGTEVAEEDVEEILKFRKTLPCCGKVAVLHIKEE